MKWESLNLGFYHEWNSFNELSRNKSSKFRLKILPENFNRTNCRPSSSHTVQREKDVGWVIVFLFLIHWWFLWLIAFRLNHRTKSSSNWKKKSSGRLSKNENLSGRVPWNRKKENRMKKEVIDTFWLFSQSTELSFFYFIRETKLIFNIKK